MMNVEFIVKRWISECLVKVNKFGVFDVIWHPFKGFGIQMQENIYTYILCE